MTVLRLLSYPATLLRRTNSGTEDSWGSPIYMDERIDTVCYFRQRESNDQDSGEVGEVENEYEVFLPIDTNPTAYDAVEVELNGVTTVLEIVGQPSPELNARTGKINHYRLRARKAGA